MTAGIRQQHVRSDVGDAPRRLGRPVRAVLLAFALVVAAALPAVAHAYMTGSDPEDEETVTEELTEVVFEFNEPVGNAEVEIVDPSGESIVDGDPEEHGDTVVQPVHLPAEHGEYAAAIRVVSQDDHPVTGEFVFVYEGPVEDGSHEEGSHEEEPEVEEEPTPEPTPTEEPTPTPTPEPTPTEDEADDEELLAAEADDDGGFPLGLLALGLLVVAAGVGGWAFRRRTQTDGDVA